MTHPAPASATSSTTRKLSPAMTAALDAMRDGATLKYNGISGRWLLYQDGQWTDDVKARTVNALIERGLIESHSNLFGYVDRYVLTPAGLAAATPPAAVTSDLDFPYADTLEEEVPLGPELDIDSLADYEAAQVSEAMRLITIRETNWYSDKPARNQAIKELALIDGHWIADAEALLKAEAVVDAQTREVA